MGMTPRPATLARRLRETRLATVAGRGPIPGGVTVGDWTLSQDENGDLIARHLGTGETRVVASLG